MLSEPFASSSLDVRKKSLNDQLGYLIKMKITKQFMITPPHQDSNFCPEI